MIKILSGPTGCGKTYQAFNRLGKKTALYLAPCRQLVYESAIKYGNINSHIKTSDIEVGNISSKLSFRTYEAAQPSAAKTYDVLIIDEAHFINDDERGDHLKHLINSFNVKNKEVVLLSATLNFNIKGAKTIVLPARGEQFIKREVSLDEALSRAAQGIPTLCFHKTRMACGQIARALHVKGAVITADTPVQQRVKIINNFNEGKITLIEATNAMAQGVNVPCANLIDYTYNGYDDKETIIQKFGRLGRTGVTPEGTQLTFYFDERSEQDIIEYKKSIDAEASKNTISMVFKKDAGVVDYDLRTPATNKEKQSLKKEIVKKWHKV